jgi:nucleoside-diphosphate-sugar epimerase
LILHAHAEARKPARVVLVGASGFIGRALRAGLQKDAVEAVALGSRDIDLTAPAAEDRLVAVLKPTDTVVMLSALTPDKGKDSATLMKNLAMMQNLCAALQKAGCAHLVYVSSDAVYGPGPARVSEETPAAPQDLYGVMHLARELMARALAKTPLLILRPTAVYGAGDTHNGYGPNRFLRSAQKEGRIQLFGAGEETRDHIHVDDVAAITCRCLEHGSTGVLNLATGRSVSFLEVAGLIAKQGAGKAEIVKTPRANPITHRHYDVTSLIKAFPHHRFITLEEGLSMCHKALR